MPDNNIKILQYAFLCWLLISLQGCNNSKKRDFIDFQKKMQIPDLILPSKTELQFDEFNIVILTEKQIKSKLSDSLDFSDRFVIVFDKGVERDNYKWFGDAIKIVLIDSCSRVETQDRKIKMGFDNLIESNINSEASVFRYKYLNFIECNQLLIPHISCVASKILQSGEKKISPENVIFDCFDFQFKYDYMIEKGSVVINDYSKDIDLLFIIQNPGRLKRFDVYRSMINQILSESPG